MFRKFYIIETALSKVLCISNSVSVPQLMDGSVYWTHSRRQGALSQNIGRGEYSATLTGRSKVCNLHFSSGPRFKQYFAPHLSLESVTAGENYVSI